MCRAISGIAVKSDDELKVYTMRHEDSHELIRKEYNIKDDLSAGATRQTPVELVPVRGVKKLDEMEFEFDAGRPDWWTDKMTEEAKRQLFCAWRNRWDGNVLQMDGDLCLHRLTSLSKDVSLEAGGTLYLDSLTSLSEGASLKAGDNLHLYSLTSIQKNCKLSAATFWCNGYKHRTSQELRQALASKEE